MALPRTYNTVAVYKGVKIIEPVGAKRSPLAKAIRADLLKGYRNGLEFQVGQQLTKAGVAFDYEGAWVAYNVPARKAKYLPDFRPCGSRIIIETKGWFGRQGAKERQKLILLKEQHPELDFRLIFSDASKRIYKGSPTTYATWALENGFRFSTKGVVPKDWIKDIKKEVNG